MRSVSKIIATLLPVLVAGSTAAGQSGGAAAAAGALFAQGDFGAAAQAYADAVEAVPNDADALGGLARMRLYENKTEEAIELAERALGMAPGNPVAERTLRTARARRKAFGPDRYKIAGLAGEETIKFVATDPLPVIQVTIGTTHSAYFLIDTGAPDIVLDRETAKQLGLKLSPAGMGVFAGGKQAQVMRTVVPELKIGSLELSNVPAGVVPGRRGLVLKSGIRTEGIIGTGFLMHFLATLDYCSGSLVLRPRGASAKLDQQARQANANIVPVWLVGDHFIFARGRLNNGSEALFSIDTGMIGGGLGATKATLDDAGVVIDSSKTRVGRGGGGRLNIIPFRADATLGTMTVKDVPGFYSPDGDPYAMFPFTVAGAFSHGFFRHSRITVDFDAMRLVTERCD